MNQYKLTDIFLTFISDWDMNIHSQSDTVTTDNFLLENCLVSIWNYLVMLYML